MKHPKNVTSEQTKTLAILSGGGRLPYPALTRAFAGWLTDSTQGEITTSWRYGLSSLGKEQRITPSVALGELSYQSGFQLAAEVIGPQTTALVCASDTIALGAIKYLQQQHIAPLQVCGIGNTPLLNFLFPETFSVELGYGSAGLQAAQQLLGQLSGEQGIRQIIVPSKLA